MIIELGNTLVTLNFPAENLLLLFAFIVLAVLSYVFLIMFQRNRATSFGNLSTLRKLDGFHRFYISPLILFTKVFFILFIFFLATDAIRVSTLSSAALTDYVLAVDTSNSMSIPDYEPTRLAAARAYGKLWIDRLPNSTNVGLVDFSRDVNSFFEPTEDHEAAKRAVGALSINYTEGGTDVSNGLDFAITLLRDSPRRKAIVLITDSGDKLEDSVIKTAIERDVVVYPIIIGDNNKTRTYYQEIAERLELDDFELTEYFDLQEVNTTSLQQLADFTDGKLFEVRGEDALQEALFETAVKAEYVDTRMRFVFFMILVLLSIAEFFIYAKFGGL